MVDTDESNTHVPVWNHKILLNALPNGTKKGDVPSCKEITFIFQCPGGGLSRAETACRKIGLAENPIPQRERK